MSGIVSHLIIMEEEYRLIKLLDRRTPINALDALVYAMKPNVCNSELHNTAIRVDANVFLRLASHPKQEDNVHYLGSRHNSAIILPGQTIQEFWNNQFQAVDSLSASIKKNFDKLREDVLTIDEIFDEFAVLFNETLSKFGVKFEYVYDEATLRRVQAFLDVIKAKALVPYARRGAFHDIAIQRKRTKTPPGFRDEGDGDFFVWVDFLLGLLTARKSGKNFDRAVWVSLDRKIDWSRGGTAHPILIAEAKALLDVPFEIWTMDRLAQEISRVAG